MMIVDKSPSRKLQSCTTTSAESYLQTFGILTVIGGLAAVSARVQLTWALLLLLFHASVL
jgi:hypothetical protein